MQQLHLRNPTRASSRSPPPSAFSLSASATKKRPARDTSRVWPCSWFIVLLWAFNFLVLEVWIYHHQIGKCEWPAPPLLVNQATLRNVAVIADPQITDINSYPFFQRHPWFGAFVCELSDRFMRKSFRILQWHRKPKHIVVAGDMMDFDYTLALARFRAIFVDDHVVPNMTFYSVAGNHDIGYFTTTKVKETLVAQFEQHFAALNYEQNIGNVTWTFVAATELSVDPNFRSPFRKQTYEFVDKLQPTNRVLVLHIPLWREQSESCTSVRQTNPQIKYQVRETYSTMLPRDTTDFLLSRAKPLLVLSGDDHDMCVASHGALTEVTVGTFSYMQGVMWPSYVLVTQWDECRPTSGCRARVAYDVCWLPSQPYILIWYAVLGVLSLLCLLLAVVTYAASYAKNQLSIAGRITAIVSEFLRRVACLLPIIALEWVAVLLLGY